MLSNTALKTKQKNGKIELFDEKGISKGFYSLKNKLNDLTGKEWQYWTKSVITNQYPVRAKKNLQHKLRSLHGAQKPPELCADLIKIFTKQGQCVLDPLMGVGGTLLGASLCKRKAIGIEINKEWLDIYKKVCHLENIDEQKTVLGDCNEILNSLNEKVDFILTDVPYWNMDKVKRSTGKYKKVGEEAKEKAQSKLSHFNEKIYYADKKDWKEKMRSIFESCLPILNEKRYMAIFVGDMYYQNEYHCLSSELAETIKTIKGIIWKANLIWYDVSNQLHIYGYQYSYIPSMIHQNILIFRKETA